MKKINKTITAAVCNKRTGEKVFLDGVKPAEFYKVSFNPNKEYLRIYVLQQCGRFKSTIYTKPHSLHIRNFIINLNKKRRGA